MELRTVWNVRQLQRDDDGQRGGDDVYSAHDGSGWGQRHDHGDLCIGQQQVRGGDGFLGNFGSLCDSAARHSGDIGNRKYLRDSNK